MACFISGISPSTQNSFKHWDRRMISWCGWKRALLASVWILFYYLVTNLSGRIWNCYTVIHTDDFLHEPRCHYNQSQSHFTVDSQSVSQSVSWYVLVSSPLCGRLTRYCFPFEKFGSGICCPVSVGPPLWREAGSVLCKSQSSHLSVCTFTIKIFLFHTFII
jgi:hypothetical protein